VKNEAAWKPTKFAHAGGNISVGPGASDSSWLMTQLVGKAYQRQLPQHARGRLIDLGCGGAPLYGAYRALVSEVTCIDWGGSTGGTQHLDLEHDLNQPLPLESARYDTVILSDVLEHIRKPEGLLSEISRILAPGGKLLLNVPFFYWLHEQPHDYFRYSEHALRFLIEQSGLSLLLLEGLGSAPEVLADMVGKHLSLAPSVGPLASRWLQSGVWRLTQLSPVARALAPSRQRFPLAYFLVAQK
jgi:SAM-dependent methyltransferase